MTAPRVYLGPWLWPKERAWCDGLDWPTYQRMNKARRRHLDELTREMFRSLMYGWDPETGLTKGPPTGPPERFGSGSEGLATLTP